ncbi:hypothetical protein P7F60_26880 [Rhizobium sp. YJ-22]|uniref:YkgJ family cysteine cluster protein n=1 Tax=Rhizobium sp. YJ-22 TaxID=3037556 RepID=UPI001ACFD307|nr:hypothetical protein [Rhizobium sp. YJ-22]MBN9032316.1 hypothetical protein [Hyphomicrobiales bacterium]MDG3580023.1 hypothetical protein [Rhizobium sp. YJ-22]
MQPTTTIVDGRSCGTCTLCCRLPDIDLFDKPANDWCAHCVEGSGCSIYPDRPSVCRDFLCLWMTDNALGDEWEPGRSGMMLYEQGPQITVLVAPEHPEIWKSEPYLSQLRTWAGEAERRGRYVIVFCQDDVFKV